MRTGRRDILPGDERWWKAATKSAILFTPREQSAGVLGSSFPWNVLFFVRPTLWITRSNVAQEVRRNYSPSERTVLYGCAAVSVHDACRRSTLAEMAFEWREVKHPLGVLVSIALDAHTSSSETFPKMSHATGIIIPFLVTVLLCAPVASHSIFNVQAGDSRYASMSTATNSFQVDNLIDVSGGWAKAYSTAQNVPVLVIRPGVLAPGRRYTFSLSAMDSLGSVNGYAGKLRPGIPNVCSF